MTDHPIDRGLRSLGVDPSDLDPDVLDALRKAGETRQTRSLEDAFAEHFAPGAEDERRKAAEAARLRDLEGTP